MSPKLEVPKPPRGDALLMLYENNCSVLRRALHSAGGSMDAMMDQTLADVLRSLALNSIVIESVTYRP